jgi:hypothetical protein
MKSARKECCYRKAPNYIPKVRTNQIKNLIQYFPKYKSHYISWQNPHNEYLFSLLLTTKMQQMHVNKTVNAE